jgi:hypothetical protein
MRDPGMYPSSTVTASRSPCCKRSGGSTHVTSAVHNSSDWTLIVGTLLSIAAVILVIVGVITVLSGSVIAGIVLIVIGCIVGPGGYSLSRR